MVLSSEGTQHLPHSYWELLPELAFLTLEPWGYEVSDSAEITKSLVEAQEWDKLECWIGVVWMSLGVVDGIEEEIEEDLESSMMLLLRRRPRATQKLKKWIERWCQETGRSIPESVQRAFERAHEAVQGQDVP